MAKTNSRPAAPEYCRLDVIEEVPGATRSAVLLAHGFPDSPRMFAAYHTEVERRQPWLQGRSMYALAFPNRHDNPHFPSLGALARGVLADEFDQLLEAAARRSPTGRLVIIAHDWGATHTWRYARAHPGSAPIEKLVALSVGSSFRYDAGEHGWRALQWLYGVVFGAAWWLPFMRGVVAAAIVSQAGYRSETASQLYRDAYHYWDRFSLLLTWPAYVLGAVGRQPEYLDFPFPVLYLRCPLDRIASTAAFERVVQSRPGCRFGVLAGANHWFPEQQAERVLEEVRPFLA